MQLTLIKAERMCYGSFRFRLEVQYRLGWFHWRRVYLAHTVPMLGPEWYLGGSLKRVWSEPLIKTLGDLLAGALLGNRVQPQPMPAAYVPETARPVPDKTRKSRKGKPSTPCAIVSEDRS